MTVEEMATIRTDSWRSVIARLSLEEAEAQSLLQSARTRLFVSQAAHRTASSAMQIHGAFGYTDEYPVERIFRDMKLAEIYAEAGLPAGAFNVVQGPASTGQLLTKHRGISKVSPRTEEAVNRAAGFVDDSETAETNVSESPTAVVHSEPPRKLERTQPNGEKTS